MSGLLGGGNRVNIDIRATNNASGVIGQVSSDLGGLSSQAGAFGGGGFGDMFGSALGAGAMIGGAAYLGGMAYDLGEMGANIEAVRFSYERLAGQIGIDSADLLTALQDASGGTIAEYDLMLAANRAMRFGVADNIGELVSIMQYAKGSAREFGSDTTSAFDDLVTGIGRNSAMILDNVGITLPQINEAYAAYAETIGKTVEDLTDLEKKQGLVNAVMAASANFDLTGTWSLDQYEANAAAMSDLGGEAGKLMNTLTGPLAGLAANSLRQINDGIDYLNRPTVELEQNLVNVNAAMLAAQQDFERNRSLLQVGTDNPSVMVNYLDAMERMNELTLEREKIQRALAGLPAERWTPGITPTDVANARQLAEAIKDAGSQAQSRPGGYGYEAQAQAIELMAAAQERFNQAKQVENGLFGSDLQSQGTSPFGIGQLADAQTQVDQLRGIGQQAQQDVMAQVENVRSAVTDMASDGASAGTNFVTSFASAIGNNSAIASSAANAGATWGSTFLRAVLGNVPQALISSLADMVTPEVTKRMGMMNSRQGAQ